MAQESIATAYLQIVPTTDGIKNELTKQLGGPGGEAGKAGGKSFGSAFMKAIAAAGIGVAVGKFIKSAVSEAADYEQLVGGVETLFGAGGQSLQEYAASVGKSVDEVYSEYARLDKAQSDVLANANNAYKTAGLSANEYMETVTGFSAALIKSLDGDTVKAASKADQALIDMADNANKMGTDIESIQNAYQGFAKQNYTMLDNLNKMGALAA